jgi:beta-galactosidase
VASLDRAIVRRVELLKAAGFNAVRCAHNPPAPAFLDACDRLGLLVINEAFDTWSLPKNPGDFGHHFNELWRDELDRMILRDRNHPSVVIWSLGNEIIFWSAPIERSLADGTKLIERAKELDPTRFVTTAIAGWNLPDEPWSNIAPLLSKMEVVGYNYATHRYESDHQRFPERVIVGTESFPRDLFATYDASDRLSHVIGDFVWTGIDYLGESGIGQYVHPDKRAYFHLDPRQYPYHGAYCGDIDITGFRKPISYARNITWGRGETLYTSVTETTSDGRKMKLTEWAVEPSHASWTWPGREGQQMEVQVYSRHDAVRLYMNSKLIGEKPTGRAEHFKAIFSVPYTPGTLRTVGLKDGNEVERSELRTAGPITGLRLTADRNQLSADGQDLAFINVESVDAAGAFQPTGDQKVSFRVEGPASIAGIASGDYSTTQSYQGSERALFHGRAQLVIRAGHQAGAVTVRASVNGLPLAETTLSIR